MALRLATSRNAGDGKAYNLLLHRLAHAFAQPAPLDGVISQSPVSPQLVLPESGQFADTGIPGIGFEFPGFNIGTGSMELMAVPKRKTSPHKRGIRNGPKALKPVPVIVRCKVCGRVKLPHFFCCSGLRENPDSQE